MALNHQQFSEHLADLEARTGLQYHPGGITLPSGLRVPAMHNHADYPNEDNTRIHEISTLMPSETGALHSMSVRTWDDHRGQHWMMQHYSVPSILRTEHPELADANVLYSEGNRVRSKGSNFAYHDSPGSWSDEVGRSLTEAKPPTGAEHERAMRLIGSNAEYTKNGQILPVQLGGYMEDFDLRSR